VNVGTSPFTWTTDNPASCSLSSSTSSSVTVTGAAVGNCTINVTDNDGLSAVTNTNFVVDTNAPASVTDLAADDVQGDQGGVIFVSWSLSADDGAGDNDVSLYEVQRSLQPETSYLPLANVSAGTGFYYDNNVTEGTTYYYRVRTCDDTGLCTTSSYDSAVPNAQPIMKYVNITNPFLTTLTDVECIGTGYDIDDEALTMFYSFTIMSFPPGGYTHEVKGIADCIFIGSNTTDQYGVYHENSTSECRAVLNHTEITKADKVVCSMIAQDLQENSTSMQIMEDWKPVNNTAPTATDVTIYPQAPNASSMLSCNYTFYDIDNDPEDIIATQYKWFINNEGLNQFVEVPNQVGKFLTGIFDKDDQVMCSVKVKDDDQSWMGDEDFALYYVNSTPITIIDNALPQIIAWHDNSNATTPINVGDLVRFNATWIDYEDPTDTARLFVCDDYTTSESQYDGANTSIRIGDDDSNAAKYVWFYSNVTGQYASTIAIRPFKFVKNDEWTYAPDTLVQSGDQFIGEALLNFTMEAYYDADGSGTYTYNEPVVLENDTQGTILQFDEGVDRVLLGAAPPHGATLSNFTFHSYRFHDRDATANFTEPDDIYFDRDDSYTVTVGDYRQTLVAEGSADRSSTGFIYDILVYEVAAIGDTEANGTSTLIARDNDNAFTLSRYNYYVPQYNAQPQADHFIGFKLCIDADNDDVCDSDGDFLQDSIYVHASNETVSDYWVLTSDGTFYYSPDIKVNYREASTVGCSNLEYCNTSLSDDQTLKCSYTAQDSDSWMNSYLMKVCDEKNGCSVQRGGTFYVNHPPAIFKVNITPSKNNYTTDANLNCTPYGVSDADNDSVSMTYRWYVRRGEGFELYDIPSNSILTNGNTLTGDEWICQALPYDSFGYGLAKNSSPVTILDSTALGSIPRVLGVVDDSSDVDPTAVGDIVTFQVTWADADSTLMRMYVCNSSSIYDNGCWGFTFNRTGLSTANPIVGTYVVQDRDFNEDYWVRVCDDSWNCSDNFPISGNRLNFSANHRPNATGVNVVAQYVLGQTWLTCNYTYVDRDNDVENNTLFKWYVDQGTGFNEVVYTTRNISTGFGAGDTVLCSVLVSDQHDLADANYRNATSALTVAETPVVPVVWPMLSAIRTGTIQVIGYVNESQMNVSAYALQGVNDPLIASALSGGVSLRYGNATALNTSQAAATYIIIDQSLHPLFVAGRFVEFASHQRRYYTRYSITGKTDMGFGTYRVDLGENLSVAVPSDTHVDVYNSSKPTGWFNITLNLFNDSNTVRVRSQTATQEGPFVETAVFVDLYPPSINLTSIPSITNTVTPMLTVNLSDNHEVNLSTVLLRIWNSSAMWNFTTPSSMYGNATPSLSCQGNASHQACSITPTLRNGVYNLSVVVNDTADYNSSAKTSFTVDTSATIVTNVTDGYIDNDGVHLPSDFATTSQLIANWTPMTGIERYEYRLDEYDAPTFIRSIVDWTDIGLNTTVNGTFNLTNGYVYYFILRAKVQAGGYTSETSSDGILFLDATPPTCSNCVHSDGPYTNSDDTLHAYWNFTDPESEIFEYRYAVGTACYPYTGYDSIIPQTTVYTNEVLLTGLVLQNGQSYCVSVSAMNENNYWSGWYTSGNVTVDTSAPFGGSVNYPTGYISSTTFQVNFTSGNDSLSGVNRTQLYVASVPLTNNACNGLFVYNPIGAQIISDTFETVTVETGYCYRFRYTVTDLAGNSVTYPADDSKTVRIDSTGPSGFTVTVNNNDFYTQSQTLSVTWTPSVDNESGISHYSYALFEGSTQMTNFINTTYLSASIYYDLEHQHSYKVKVIAYNKVNESTSATSNEILFIDTTPPATVTLLRLENESDTTAFIDTNQDNRTNITVAGEMDIECVVSEFAIDFTDDTTLPYISNCTTIGSGPNVTCSVMLNDGNYTRYIACRDEYGNQQTWDDNLRVDWITDGYGPNITIVSPAMNETVGGIIALDADVIDAGVGTDQVWYNITSYNSTLQTQGTLSAPNYKSTWDVNSLDLKGAYIFNVAANDTLGHVNTASVIFVIGDGVPILTVRSLTHTHENFTLTVLAQLFVNMSFNITNATGYQFAYDINASGSMRSYLTWMERVNISSPTDWPEGNYSIRVWAINNETNSTAKTSYIVVDRTSPSYGYFLNTSVGTYYNDDMVTLNASWNDTYGMDTVIFSHNAIGNWTNATATGSNGLYTYNIQHTLLDNQETVGWYSIGFDKAGNINASMPVQLFTISNRLPNVTVSNVTANASELVTFGVTAVDKDGDTLTYSVNDSRFTQFQTGAFRWNSTINDSGTHIINVSVNDTFGVVSELVYVTLQAPLDTDGDGIPDYNDPDADNDGYPNTIDFLNGFSWSVNTTIANFNCSVGGDFNLVQQFNGTHVVNCTNGTQPLLWLTYDFSKGTTLSMAAITLQRQANGSAGWTRVKGVGVQENHTKALTVQDLNASISTVCIKDTEAATVADISSNCTQLDEHMVNCDGSLHYGNFTCRDMGSFYEVLGLSHSAVGEQTGCTDRDGDSYGVGCAAGSDYDDNDAGVHSPPTPPRSTGGSGGSGSSRTSGGGIVPACANLRDDDGDGLIDMDDPGCLSPSDFDERDACIEDWVCTEWTVCSEPGLQARECLDKGECGTEAGKPLELRSCEVGPVAPLAQPTCYDGIQNQGEAAIDCGGHCAPCPTCVDGLRNQGETDVDCGGPCPSCLAEAKGFWLFSPIGIGLMVLVALLIGAVALLMPKRHEEPAPAPPPEPKPIVIKPIPQDTPKQHALVDVMRLVLAHLHHGTPRSEIEAALRAKRWPVTIIDHVIKLENYVRAGLGRGYPYALIKASLMRIGWHPEIIDAVYGYCRPR
jgi:hypothetical protein